jgi:putative ABC transport system permease protein
MNPVDILKISGQGVQERKFRFALNLLGILIGCTAITGLISITQGLSNDVAAQLDVFGPTNIIIIPGELRQGQGIVGDTLSWRDLETIKKVSKVEAATPIIANKFCEFNVRGHSFRTDLYGITHEYLEINKNNRIKEGRGILRTDTSVVVIGSHISHPLDEEEKIIEVGDRINIKVQVQGEEREITVRVIGILDETGSSFGTNLDDSVAIPFRTAQQLFDIGGEIDYVLAQAASIEEVEEAVAEIEEKMGEHVTVMSQASAQETVGAVIDTIEAVLGGIAGISLLVAGVGIVNTMTVSVMERTKEIGTMKAIGAKSIDVLILFLSEAAITGLIGGGLGAGFGFLLSGIISNFIGLEAAVSLSLWIFVVGFAVATSILSGLYPAWRASNLNPVEALRHE